MNEYMKELVNEYVRVLDPLIHIWNQEEAFKR